MFAVGSSSLCYDGEYHLPTLPECLCSSKVSLLSQQPDIEITYNAVNSSSKKQALLCKINVRMCKYASVCTHVHT